VGITLLLEGETKEEEEEGGTKMVVVVGNGEEGRTAWRSLLCGCAVSGISLFTSSSSSSSSPFFFP